MPLDFNILNGNRSVLDQAQLQRDFELRKEAALAEVATKQNALKYQTIAAGAANGAEGLANAKAKLAQLGIDASDYSDDPAIALKQAYTGQQAASPYGTIFNAQQKVIGNNIAAANAFGSTDNPFMQQTPGIMPTTQAAPTNAPAPNPTQQTVGQPNPAGSMAVPPVNNFIDGNTPPAGAPTTPPPVPNFQMPAQLPSETRAAYDMRIKNDPAVIAAQKQAEEAGKLQAGNDEAAKKAAQLTQRLAANLDAMDKLNESGDLPNGGFFGADTKAALSRGFAGNRLGSGNLATAVSQWDKINNQQVVSDIQQFLAAGGAGARINQTLDKIIRSASSINPSDSQATRRANIANTRAEINNLNSSAQNIAGDNQPYQQLPVTTSGNARNFQGFKYLGVKK